MKLTKETIDKMVDIICERCDWDGEYELEVQQGKYNVNFTCKVAFWPSYYEDETHAILGGGIDEFYLAEVDVWDGDEECEAKCENLDEVERILTKDVFNYLDR